MRIVFLAMAATALLTACSTVKQIVVEQPKVPTLKTSGIATAAAINVDITPGPGMPMAGYSITGNFGEGFRTRLKARIVYINDGQGESIALVQTDNSMGSLLVHHQVATAVAGKTGLKPSDIVITATHSHSGLANHMDNDFFNKHASPGQGFEEKYVEFLSARIADGILKAYQDRRPAMVAAGSKDIYGYNRNRSIDAYVRNPHAQGIDPEDPKSVFEAVNPALEMIRVDVQDDDGQFKPLAAFSSFSVHATTISPKVDVYNGDLFTYAQKDLEWAIQQQYQTPWPVVHALTSGTAGDMAPAVKLQGDNYFGYQDLNWKEAKRVGQGIGREAIVLFNELGAELSAEIDVSSAARELNIQENNTIADVEMCADPAIGVTAVAGAFERRTPWLSVVPFFDTHTPFSRSWFFNDGCQGNKSIAGTKYLQALVEPKETFPNTVMFQLIRINDAVILPLPFEVTVESGKRMAARVAQELSASGAPAEHVWVANNANGYFGYTTTPEEYERQNYEAGQSHYGKYSTPYLTEQLGSLTKDMMDQGQVQEYLPQWSYKLKLGEFMPEQEDSLGQRAVIEQPESFTADDANEENYVAFEWLDVNASQINFADSLVRVEVKQGDQWVQLLKGAEPIHDDGYDIEVRYTDDADQGMGEYSARWYNPIAGGEYRFVIADRQGLGELISTAFTVGDQAPEQDKWLSLVE